jgi:hypothetical protein
VRARVGNWCSAEGREVSVVCGTRWLRLCGRGLHDEWNVMKWSGREYGACVTQCVG